LSVISLNFTQAVEIFGNISMAFGTLAIRRHPQKVVEDIPKLSTTEM